MDGEWLAFKPQELAGRNLASRKNSPRTRL
jgi:hypothetical protein